ncbi:twin-arginine translocase subunit TatC [Corynebacterium poyangense]|uniref:Sec-independent protein translocase protein TatC n=2 Tax=Corynebacterium poyangense TaxID=2684405 RepID=A0A7H0SSA4_9CORY|nr:twin-arginine translocase subunit TatC [Corynebacterium poyangense]MBZ8177770.1 twin-arginine translocase subunit TatC [Corynebacterium poyangense]QNQ91429.1 twin-arginine translocase subunit TatC [Corynebacterium poyangense]
MTLVEHLKELRYRVIVALSAVAIGTVVGFIWYQHGVHFHIREWSFRIESLGNILRGPYCSLPPEKRASFTPDGECRLLATSPFEMFLLRLKVGSLAGIVFSSPVWLYQIWAFITPGLHKKEKRFTFTFVTLAVILFFMGAVVSYFVLAVGLEFLLSMGDEYQSAALSGHDYFYYVVIVLVVFGVSFEVPLIIAALNIVGILSYEHVRNKRRIIIIALAILAAVVTPGQDPFSMMALTFCLCLLTEIAFQFCRWNDKRRKQTRPDWMDVADDESSPLETHPEPIQRPSHVAPSTTPRTSPVPNPQTQQGYPGAFDSRGQTNDGPDFSDVL